ncbi:MAG: hypothetical protein QXH07_02445 [Thermoplasmata archaeon]
MTTDEEIIEDALQKLAYDWSSISNHIKYAVKKPHYDWSAISEHIKYNLHDLAKYVIQQARADERKKVVGEIQKAVDEILGKI